MRPTTARTARQAGCCFAPAATATGAVSATLAETLMEFLATVTYATVTYGAVSSRNGTQAAAGSACRAACRVFLRLEELEQERQLLRRVPGQVMVLGVADDELRV